MAQKSPLEILAKNEKRIDMFSGLTSEEKKISVSKINKLERESPKIPDFEGIYGLSELKVDQEYINSRERKFTQETEQEKELHFLGKVLEFVVNEFGNSWLPGVFSKSSRFDDYKNGVDVIWEYSTEDNQAIRLALDVTSDVRKTGSKLESAQGDFQLGRFREIKYFKSEIDETVGRCFIPRIVAGTDLNNAIGLAKLLVKESNTSTEASALKEALRTKIRIHPFGGQFLRMALEQINRGVIILESLPSTTEVYSKINDLDKIKETLREALDKYQKERNKKAPKDSLGGKEANGVLEAIEYALSRFGNPRAKL